ncbi:hypothetical protein ES703_08631 [subsurface metagenome]
MVERIGKLLKTYDRKEGVVKDLMEKYEEHFLKTLKKNTINKINTNLKRSRIKTASIFIT